MSKIKLSRESDEPAFHAVIRDNPLDPTPRLVYADWLEENGKADHADAVRDDVTEGRYRGHDHLLAEVGLVPFDHAAMGKGRPLTHAEIYHELGEYRPWMDADAEIDPSDPDDVRHRLHREASGYRKFSDPDNHGVWRVFSDGSAHLSDDYGQEPYTADQMASFLNGSFEPPNRSAVDAATHSAAMASRPV